MASAPRTRKRVRAIARAPDGSAFQKCDMCGVSVAISLADMHECQSTQEVKRFKGIRASPNVNKERFWDQPRSGFCIFMYILISEDDCFREKFKEERAKEGKFDEIEIDRKGFDTWKNMSMKRRHPYVHRAAFVDFVHGRALYKEEQKISKGYGCHESSEDYDDAGHAWHSHLPQLPPLQLQDDIDLATVETSQLGDGAISICEDGKFRW
ncbi:High mobility group B protein [Trema orientale]|uniref:High mobility group B protein n=1 Tax=Trema orientale TaxID=63057 RepID=A0A2P5AHI2_TREOI|nr:High mobility group B protein [Trema orientale]